MVKKPKEAVNYNKLSLKEIERKLYLDAVRRALEEYWIGSNLYPRYQQP